MAFVIWTCILVLCTLVFLYFRRNANRTAEFWPSRQFPTVDFRKVIGSFISSLIRPKGIRQIDELLYAEIKDRMHQPYAGTHFMGMPILMITDLDLAKRILVKDSDHFLARPVLDFIKNTEDQLLASMLFFMEGEPWKELRSKMSPTFTTGKIKRMFHIFESSSKKLVACLEDEAACNGKDGVELMDAYGRYTMDVIASSAFGIDAQTFAEKDPVFLQMAKKVQLEPNFKVMLNFLMLTFLPKVAAALGMSAMDKEMGKFFTRVILDTVQHREKTGERRDDFLQLMLEARSGQLKGDGVDGDEEIFEKSPSKSSSIVLTDEVLVAQSVLFIFGGYDTTQTLLTFAMYELALNQEMQETLREELETSWRSTGGFNYDTVNQLEYLDKVVNETLRKYPPITRLDRKAMADYKIPDTDLVIPKGAAVIIPIFNFHRDEDYFHEPDKFDPERFSPEQKAARHPYAFQAFGHGPRNCIGMRFALTNAKMAIATLVHRFLFEPCEKTPIPIEFTLNFLKPKGGMHLKVTRRSDIGNSA